MAKFKLKIGALPDFKLKVPFVLPNGSDCDITFTVRHKKSSDVEELFDKGANNLEFIKFLCVGWDLEEEFNDENIGELCSLFPSIPLMLPQEYFKALAGYRVKN